MLKLFFSFNIACFFFFLSGSILVASPPKQPDHKKATSQPSVTSSKIIQQINTLQASFVQQQFYSFMKMPVVRKGKFFIAKDRLAWDVEEPSPSRILVIEKEAYLYYPRLNHLKRIDLRASRLMGEVVSNLSMFCRVDVSELSRIYKISQRHQNLELIPRNEIVRRMIARIHIVLDERGLAKEVKIYAPDGDRVEISFTKMQLNQPLPANIFRIPKK